MNNAFSISERARNELLSRLAISRGVGVCQFCFVHLQQNEVSDMPEGKSIGPLAKLLDALGLTPQERNLSRLDVGVLPRSEVPQNEIRDISGVAMQLNEFWREQLAGFELDYDGAFFLIEHDR